MNSNTGEKIQHLILAFLTVLGVYVFLAYFFDFYYDLNDDVAIKDILSGVYTGKPDGHTNQMLYPIGWAISCFYCLLPESPVFGIFLCGCFGGCFLMITYRIQKFFNSKKARITADILMAAVLTSMMLWELVYVQYSVVCGLLAGTACFWFYTTDVSCSVREFWRQNLPALLLVWLSFLVRSEMLLLTTPFLAVAGIWHWADAAYHEMENYTGIGKKKKWQHVLSKENLSKYLLFVGVFLAGLGIAQGMEHVAYRQQQWQEYQDFFDARTRVYDFTWYPEYENAQEFYENNGISRNQYQLLDNYNFGLDETITANTLENVASYGEKAKKWNSVGEHIQNAIWELGNRCLSLSEAPYICFIWLGYALVLGLAVVQKNKEYILKLILLLIMRSIPWLYLIYMERVVDRIAHPLYAIEFLILIAVLVKELYDRPLWNRERYYRMMAAVVMAVAVIISLPFAYGRVKDEQGRREEILVNQLALDSYAKEHAENYYYLDVYSTVSFVEKMFDNTDNSKKNYDLLGGWLCKSPLQEDARAEYVLVQTQENGEGKEAEPVSIAELLLTENFYFVADTKRDITFIEEFYKSYGMEVRLEPEAMVGEGEYPFCVYKVLEIKAETLDYKKQ